MIDEVKKELKKRKIRPKRMLQQCINVTQAITHQKSENHRQKKSADDVEVKKRAKKAKIKAKKDVLALQKSYTGNNSPKMTPKKRNSQAEKCRLIVEVKKRAKKAKINAKKDASAVYK